MWFNTLGTFLLPFLVFFLGASSLFTTQNKDALDTSVSSSRIFNGATVNPTNYLYLVTLDVTYTGNHKRSCMGFVVTVSDIVTTSSCLVNAVSVIATCGASNNLSSQPQVIRSSVCPGCFKLHNLWAASNAAGQNDFDIAVLSLETNQNYQLNGFCALIALPGNNLAVHYVTDVLTSVGWGFTTVGSGSGGIIDYRPQPINALQAGHLILVDSSVNSSCVDAYGVIDFPNQMCLLPSPGGTAGGICNGDIGGPLLFRTSNNVLTAVGVATWAGSFIQPCGDQNYPSVFSNLIVYNNWVHDRLIRPDTALPPAS